MLSLCVDLCDCEHTRCYRTSCRQLLSVDDFCCILLSWWLLYTPTHHWKSSPRKKTTHTIKKEKKKITSMISFSHMHRVRHLKWHQLLPLAVVCFLCMLTSFLVTKHTKKRVVLGGLWLLKAAQNKNKWADSPADLWQEHNTVKTYCLTGNSICHGEHKGRGCSSRSNGWYSINPHGTHVWLLGKCTKHSQTISYVTCKMAPFRPRKLRK